MNGTLGTGCWSVWSSNGLRPIVQHVVKVEIMHNFMSTIALPSAVISGTSGGSDC